MNIRSSFIAASCVLLAGCQQKDVDREQASEQQQFGPTGVELVFMGGKSCLKHFADQSVATVTCPKDILNDIKSFGDYTKCFQEYYEPAAHSYSYSGIECLNESGAKVVHAERPASSMTQRPEEEWPKRPDTDSSVAASAIILGIPQGFQ